MSRRTGVLGQQLLGHVGGGGRVLGEAVGTDLVGAAALEEGRWTKAAEDTLLREYA